MVNMLKILIAATVLVAIIGYALLGKKIKRALNFKTAKTPSNESIVLEWITGLLMAGLGIAYYIKQDPAPDITMFAGIVIYAAGWIIQFIAKKQLYEDDNFEKRLMAGFELATTGMYSKIRHPSKSALLLIMFGLCFALGSIWGLAIYIFLFVPSVLYRISQEEQAMLDKFGERWMDYQEDSKRIIPGIL